MTRSIWAEGHGRHECFPLNRHACHLAARWVLLLAWYGLAMGSLYAQGVPAASEARTLQGLEQQLQQQSASELAERARREGDAARGAVVFFQPQMLCSKCHAVGEEPSVSLGPNLALLGTETPDEALVESLLWPSKVIRPEYAAVTVLTQDGRSHVGIIVEQNTDRVVLRDLARFEEQITLATRDVESAQPNAISAMPAGQINQLASQQQFLDLVQYLREIRAGGPERARALQPSPTLLTLSVPEYEQRLDHAGLIATWGEESLRRGEAIYQRVCANCHGTHEQLGSLPTSLRFAEGKFKNGSDPFAIYQTLTHGFGMMAAQTWMVPSQKYDVIHYLRETYLRPHNPSQWVAVDDSYLARLPQGDTQGPEPSKIEVWSAMDYGPSLIHTYEVPTAGGPPNLAYKGIAVRLDPGAGGVARGAHWMMFDTDTLRVAAAWSAASSDAVSERFVDWRGIQFNGEHQVHPHIVGRVGFANGTAPGWADPNAGGFRDEQRVLGRDGRRYGPLPRAWAKFRGFYHFEQQVILSYTVGSTRVLELPRLVLSEEDRARPVFVRTLNLGPRDRDLVLQIAEPSFDAGPLQPLDDRSGTWVRVPGAARDQASSAGSAAEQDATFERSGLLAGVLPRLEGVTWQFADGSLRITVPAGDAPLRFSVAITSETSPVGPTISSPGDASRAPDRVPIRIPQADLDLAPLTHGGPARWPQRLLSQATLGPETGPLAVDLLTPPEVNPWLAQTRFTGLDFLDESRVALCTWDGDVWIVTVPAASTGAVASGGETELVWQRVASGLFQPLGLRVVDGQIHVTCRDQLAVLHDLNGDGETDYYECLNNDHQVTEHYHEFAMGLQTDAAGNFYYAKSGRHALEAVVPHHGTLLRVSRDGLETRILATGFRAANGVCLNPDGSFFVTDQEGFWNPKNRINWVTVDPQGKPKFYGNMFGYHDVTDSADSAMEPPLCWITNAFDRSPAELLWVDSPQWGPLHGSLLNLSYGYGKLYLVPQERLGNVMQGGMIELPLPAFPSGVMRGRFRPLDRQLYLCGMSAWGGSATHPGGFYRVRATGRPFHLPSELQATRAGLQLRFTEPLDPGTVSTGRVDVKSWSLKRTANYGSEHYDERTLSVRHLHLSPDGHGLTIELPEIQPTWCMEIKYSLTAADGAPIRGVIHNTIHVLRDN